MTRYGAIIDGKRGGYGVVIPDLPGCTAMGKTIDEAITNAASAVIDWVTVARADGHPIPKPRLLEVLRDDPEIKAALAVGGALVVVPPMPTVTEAAALSRATLKLFKRWGVTNEQRAILLGIREDRKARLSNLMGIHKALKIIFRQAPRGYAWIKAPNDTFGGRSALDVMLSGELSDLVRVRRYLDAEAQDYLGRIEYGVYT